jgi:hypothetical protein
MRSVAYFYSATLAYFPSALYKKIFHQNAERLLHLNQRPL